jgi:hypothetical protein
MSHSSLESKNNRSAWRATLRSAVAGVLVASLVLVGPALGEMKAADQPIVNISVAPIPPMPVTEGNFGIPDTQPTPASRWSILPPDSQANDHGQFENVALVNFSPAPALPLNLSVPRNLSLAPSPLAPPPPPSFGPPPRIGFLIMGIVGVGVAVLGGIVLGAESSHCTASYVATSNHQNICNDVKGVGYGFLGAGIGLGAVGFVFSFHH